MKFKFSIQSFPNVVRACLVVVSFGGISACVTTPGNQVDRVLSNSTRDTSNHPLWLDEANLKKYLAQTEDGVEKGKYVYRVVFRSVKEKADLDLCKNFLLVDAQQSFQQSIKAVISSLAEEAVAEARMTEKVASRLQNSVKALRVEGKLSGIELDQFYWEQVARGAIEKKGAVEHECYGLVRMPREIYERQMNAEINGIDGATEAEKKLLTDNRENLQKVIDKASSR